MSNISSERPIFVVGAPRSGTTILRYMLCSHPRIFIPPESSFIPRFLGRRQPRPMSRQQAIRMMGKILKYKPFFMDWQGPRPDPVTFVDNLSELSSAVLISVLFNEYAKQFGAERWGDKSPINTSYVDLLAVAFPSAQFIHIIRDGRDVALSMVKAFPKEKFFYSDICYAARSWKRRVRKAITSKIRQDAGRYYELRYEHLVDHPEVLLREICDFLGEDYDPAMTEPHKMASQLYHSIGIYASTRKPLTTNSAGRWRREMSEVDLRLFQTLSGDLLDDLGYETISIGEMSTAEQAISGWLLAKYAIVELGRRTLRAIGFFNPSLIFTEKFRVWSSKYKMQNNRG